MTTARTHDLVAAAVAAGGAVPAFNAITLEHAEGIAQGLARSGSAGIIQLSERALLFRAQPVESILAACATLIAGADAAIALHLDHIQDQELATRLIDSAEDFGVTSIMVDFATFERSENVKRTRDAVLRARSLGLFVEAELGEIGGKDGAHAAGARTDPDDAREFVAETGVDALAVAIGSSHAMTTRDATLDLGLLARLAAAVPVPLVLHGSSGVSDDELTAAVTAGIRKVNIGTALNLSFSAAIRRVLDERPALSDPREYLRGARDAVADTVAEYARVLGAQEGRS